MSRRKYTEEQLKIAREIVDQEEAIAAERDARQRKRRSAVVKSVSTRVKKPPFLQGKKNERTRKALQRAAIGLGFFWFINWYFQLYAVSGETSLYRTVLIWAIPLCWLAVVGISWLDQGKPDRKPGEYSAGDYAVFTVVGILVLVLFYVIGS
jgi:hypothetical protein